MLTTSSIYSRGRHRALHDRTSVHLHQDAVPESQKVISRVGTPQSAHALSNDSFQWLNDPPLSRRTMRGRQVSRACADHGASSFSTLLLALQGAAVHSRLALSDWRRSECSRPSSPPSAARAACKPHRDRHATAVLPTQTKDQQLYTILNTANINKTYVQEGQAFGSL